MWNTTSYDFGEIYPETQVEALFKYSGDKKIFEVSASCGCTVPKADLETGEIKAIYTSGRVPFHLADTGQKVSKKITVTFTDGTQQVLAITGLIKNKKK